MLSGVLTKVNAFMFEMLLVLKNNAKQFSLTQYEENGPCLLPAQIFVLISHIELAIEIEKTDH